MLLTLLEIVTTRRGQGQTPKGVSNFGAGPDAAVYQLASSNVTPPAWSATSSGMIRGLNLILRQSLNLPNMTWMRCR
jgi:hypothetical protein